MLNGTKEGSGSEQTTGGTVYLGEFRKGCRSGIGMLVTADKDKYVGEYYNGNENGLGINSSGDIDTIGYWRDGLTHGLSLSLNYVNCRGSLAYWNSGE